MPRGWSTVKRQKNRWVAWVAALLVLQPFTALAHRATIADGGGSQYKSVRLTPEIYANASPGLGDLRLEDGAGNQVPYFILSGSEMVDSQETAMALRQVDSFEKDGWSYFDFALAQQTPFTDSVATSLVLETNDQPFAKVAQLLGSYDGLVWEPICQDTIFQVEGLAQLEIVFPIPQKFTHYRVGLSNNQEQITWLGAGLRHSAQTQVYREFCQTMAVPFATEQKGRQTLITLSGLKHLRVTEITLEVEGMFSRRVEAPGASKLLYQLSFDTVAYRDTTLPLAGDPLQQDTLTLTVENGDDKPLKLQGVQVTYAVDELVFAGTQGPYTLTFGAGLTPPQYDIAQYRQQVLAQPRDALALGQVALENPAPPPAESKVNWQLIFNGVVLAVAALLGFILLLRMKKAPRDGA